MITFIMTMTTIIVTITTIIMTVTTISNHEYHHNTLN